MAPDALGYPERVDGGEYTFSMQQGMDNLHLYMDWINSCRLLVTNDSLGLHIALASEKKWWCCTAPPTPMRPIFTAGVNCSTPMLTTTASPA